MGQRCWYRKSAHLYTRLRADCRESAAGVRIAGAPSLNSSSAVAATAASRHDFGALWAGGVWARISLGRAYVRRMLSLY